MRQGERIDILLATYNGERFVDRQIESVLEQMDADCRLLVRDDGSSDGTLPIVRRFVRQQPGRVLLLEEGGMRLGACANFGWLLEHAEADYVALCDQDDVWLPGHLSRPLEQIRKAEQELGTQTPVLAHSDLVVVDEDLRTIAPSFWSYSTLDPHGGSRLNRLLVQNGVTGCATMMNRTLARRACPIPGDALMHDWWLALVASALGRIETVREPTLLYRQHANNRLGATGYNWRYMLRRGVEVLFQGVVAKCLRDTQRQAAALLQRFATELSPRDRAAIVAYVDLGNAGFFDRRLQMLRHGFLKNGRLRNVGWLAMV
jgi:glycosyltransferase involved in cell wall biosynthesis